jgi:hypothetical protein
LDDIREATKQSNFNKGLGPDCFDGNILNKNEQLSEKVLSEIAEALNNATIPDYLRVGRLVPLQKTFTKGPCALDEIRPIVVRSHCPRSWKRRYLRGLRPSSLIS